MRCRVLAAAVLLTATGLTPVTAGADTPPNPDWKQYRYDETHSGFNPAETTISAANVAGIALRWAKAPAQHDPLVVHGKVLSCTTLGCTSRLLGDGAQQWRSPGIVAESITVGGDRLYAINSKASVAEVFDVNTGTETNVYLHEGQLQAPLTFHAGRVYETSGQHGHAYALDPTNGGIVWESAKAFGLGDYYATGPTIAANTFYASGCHLLYALREDTGRYRWSTDLPGTASDACGSLPAVADGRVVVTTTAVDAFDAGTGALLWSTPGPGGRLNAPALAYGSVFAVSPGADAVAAYSAADGRLRWSVPVAGAEDASVPTVANGLVFVATSSGLHVIDATTGAAVTTVPGSFSGEPVVSNGSVVVDCVDATLGPALCAFGP